MGVVSLVTIQRRIFPALTSRNKKMSSMRTCEAGTTRETLMLSFLRRFDIDTSSYRGGHLNFGELFIKVILFEEKG